MPREQLAMCARCRVPLLVERQARHHYRKMEKIPDDLGTAVNVQAMVFGNLGDTSATGVGFTRNPVHRREGFLRRVPGQRAGRRRGGRHPHAAADLASSRSVMPAAYNQLREITTSLEKHYRDMQDFEFTIQDGKLYMLQTRNGKRTGPAAVRIAVEMVDEGLITTRRKPCCACDPQQLDQLLHPVLDPALEEDADASWPTGLPASPGAAVGRVVFTADDAVEHGARRPGDPGARGDRAGRHSRHGSGEGHSDRARRHDQPRGGGRARHGHALRGGRRRASTVNEHKKEFTVDGRTARR